MSVWDDLRDFSRGRNGRSFRTSLIGRVRFIDENWRIRPMNSPPELTGWIPPDLQRAAEKEGFVIEAALWREGVYVLRELTLQQVEP